ncbi:MAG: class C sortase [Oscillospiraceae bacterium]|nr:class C sortase [Oscillospiraceae bacterium]
MKKKISFSTVALVLVLLIGLSLLLYPTFSDWWNSRVQSQAVANYSDAVSTMEDEEYTEVWNAAKTHNKSLLARTNPYLLTETQEAQYPNLLNVAGHGVMGYVEIPAINQNLPLYHGTDESVLQVAIGHLQWTSLPTGGPSTHCVVSGHRGLPSARLFTDLDQLEVGDVFMVHVLDELLTYEVDQILIVEPQETEELLIQEGKDLFTLVTCTPYSVNTHRMLVRGHRVENAEEAVVVRVTADALQVEPMLVAVFLVVPFLLILMSAAILFDKLRNRDNN